MLVKSGEIGISARLAQTAAVFIITSVISLLLLSKASPVLWEDHFQIGQNLEVNGDTDDRRCTFDPPSARISRFRCGRTLGRRRDFRATRRSIRALRGARSAHRGVRARIVAGGNGSIAFLLGVPHERFRGGGWDSFHSIAESVFAGACECRLLSFIVRCVDHRFHAGTVVVAAFSFILADRQGGRNSLGPDVPGEARRAAYSVFRCAVDAVLVAAKRGHQVVRLDPGRDGPGRRPLCRTQLHGNRTADHNRSVRFRVLGLPSRRSVQTNRS